MNYDIFLLSFLSIFLDMYRMDSVLYLILLISEILKITKAKVKAHFLKKLAFVTNNCSAQDAVRKYPRSTENLSNYTPARE